MRNPLHSICPYFAVFPEAFVQTHIFAFSQPGDCILDPFCGRGTAILESLLNHRVAIGTDINPVAACISGAKANVPNKKILTQRLVELEDSFIPNRHPVASEFFEWCFD